MGRLCLSRAAHVRIKGVIEVRGETHCVGALLLRQSMSPAQTYPCGGTGILLLG
jgi:hypothetical protein